MKLMDSQTGDVLERTGFIAEGIPRPGLIPTSEFQKPRHSSQRLKYRSLQYPKSSSFEAVYELNGSPCIHFIRHEGRKRPTSQELQDIQSVAWNHGRVPLVWVIGPTSVSLIDSFQPPSEDDKPDSLLHTFVRAEKGIKLLRERAGYFQIQTGSFWKGKLGKEINRRNRVDQRLLKDLLVVRDHLIESGLPEIFSGRLLRASLFIAFLRDRGVITQSYMRDRFDVATIAEAFESIEDATNVFKWIDKKVGGDFKFGVRKYDIRQLSHIRPKHIDLLRCFLEGTEMKTFQGRLWPYRFDVIPVEVVSAVYEGFAHQDDKSLANRRATHYTPLNLVEFVYSMIGDRLRLDDKILDPACGSGVFLVEGLRHLVAAYQQAGYDLTFDLVDRVLANQIYGIDISQGAIEIAALSLHLSAFEYSEEQPSPEQLDQRGLIGRCLFSGDYFEKKFDHAPFSEDEADEAKFGLVVGNPPWTWSSETRRSTNDWLHRRADSVSEIARQSPDQAFALRSASLVRGGGWVCFVMSARPFYSNDEKSRQGRETLLREWMPHRMINFSELRNEKLFPHTSHPAFVFVAENAEAEEQDNEFEFGSIEFDPQFCDHGLLQVSLEQLKRLSTRRTVQDSDLLKVATWAGPRDFDIVRNLRLKFPSLGTLVSQRSWSAGQGLQRAKGSNPVPEEMRGRHVLEAGDIERYAVSTDNLAQLEEKSLHRPRDPEIYRSPTVIVARAVDGTGITAGVSEEGVLYSEAYWGIALALESDDRWVPYLNVMLNSRLVSAWVFLTASWWGIERSEVKPMDVKRIPVPDIEGVDNGILDAIQEVNDDAKGPGQLDSSGAVRDEIDQLVASVYGLDEYEVLLLEDVFNAKLELFTHRISASTLKSPSFEELSIYVDTVTEYLNSAGVKAEIPLIGKVLTNGDGSCDVVWVGTDTKELDLIERLIDQSDILSTVENIWTEVAQMPVENWKSARVMRVYTREGLVIVKPSELRYWSRGEAVRDGDDIINDHFMELRRSNHKLI